MNTTAAHLNHDTHASGERTLKEWAEITGRVPDNMMRTIRRKLPGQSHSVDDLMSADQFFQLFPKEAKDVRHQGTGKKEAPADTTPKRSGSTRSTGQSSALPFSRYRKPILYTLMGMPAIASVQNMYTVTVDIASHWVTAGLLTGLFSISPFLFVIAGVRSEWTKALAAAMIGYECFSNVTRIYGGLTGFGHGDFPTRFLGLVTDIFNSGTYETAKALAVIMALMAASVFYAAYFELNRRPTK